MNEDLADFLHSKGKMTDSSECGSIIECLQTALESRDMDGEKHTLADDLDHLDCMLNEFEGWAESLKSDLARLRKEHVKP